MLDLIGPEDIDFLSISYDYSFKKCLLNQFLCRNTGWPLKVTLLVFIYSITALE